MSSSRTSLGRRLTVVALATVLVYSGCAVVLNDFPHNVVGRLVQREDLLASVQKHQALWKGAEIAHYRIAVKNQGYTSYWLMCNADVLEVKDGIVISTEGAGKDAQWCADVYRDLTVEGLFELTQEYILRNDPIRVRINSLEYDETFGFISHLSVSVTPIFVDPYLYGDDYLAITEPEYFQIWLTDFQPLN